MPSNWNKGLTKYTSPAVLKISETMKRKKIDNFKKWREGMKKEGKIKTFYPSFEKNGDLAELLGLVLGDGHIGVFPRSEVLIISFNSKNTEQINRYVCMVEKIFKKTPAVSKVSGKNCIIIKLYEKNISKRLNIPTGSRKKVRNRIPVWILSNKDYIVRYLRGLYEAEGSRNIHKPTCTYKLIFCNKNKSLLNNVFYLLKRLGFNPHKSLYKIQISRREEFFELENLLQFRKY